jgi:hypothetical protein
MTFGVDQCRCCGTPIKPKSPEQMQEYLDSFRYRKPTMTEAEWRGKGYLAMPTRRQMHMPQAGCCQPCAQREVRKQTKPTVRFLKVVGGVAVAFTLIWTVALYITH